jgi:heat-inducible transcriptional repressor
MVLSSRRQAILKFIIEQYIAQALPVPSQDIVGKHRLAVSSATVRNEMAALEEEGYILRPHTSAGSVPSDKGYRYYVETLEKVCLPVSDRLLIDHLFHQVEEELESWISLAATLLAQLTRNVAVISLPKSEGARFKHIELVGLQDYMALVVLVLYGAKVKQQLIAFKEMVSQEQLTAISAKLNQLYFGLETEKVAAHQAELSPLEKQVSDELVKMLHAEDEKDREDIYLEGWHFLLDQPEFLQTRRIQSLLELAEQRNLLRTILPPGFSGREPRVVIGRENEAEQVQEYSVVVSQYGFPGEAVGTVGVVGPTRMQYERSLPAVEYLSAVLSALVGELYGRKLIKKDKPGETS